MEILNVNQLFKTINKRIICNNITFKLSEGEIVGFVGPNGAGKTTTMRLITNQIFYDSGTVSICGHDLAKEREQALSCVSAIIENTGLYPYLTGIEHLKFIAKMRSVEKSRIDEVIEFSGLSKRINDKVKNYSLGMKQRLLLSISLLTDPQLLILDEPTNGLDPTGIIVLREKIKDLSKNNKTAIFISSHALSEIEKICDRIIFIKEGVIVLDKNRSEMLAQNRQTYKMNISNFGDSKLFNESCDYILEYSLNHGLLSITIDNSKFSELLNYFTQKGIHFSNVELLQSNIENDYSRIFRENNDINHESM